MFDPNVLKPSWYWMDYDPRSHSIFLHLHQVAFDFLKSLPFSGGKFGVDVPFDDVKPNSDFGFARVMKFVKTESDWHIYSFVLPQYSLQEDKNRIYYLRKTLAVLFRWLEFENEFDCPDHLHQMFIIYGFGAEMGIEGAGLSVAVCPLYAKWSESNQDDSNALLKLAKEMMLDADRFMWPGHTRFSLMRVTYTSSNGLYFYIDINARTLSSCTTTIDHSKGYCLHPHNIDSPLDQFFLLVGIASIWGTLHKQLSSK